MKSSNNQLPARYYQATQPKRMPVPASMRSKRNLIGLVFYNFCKQTTVHGVNHFSSVKTQRSRIFWILIVCSAALGFTINLVQIIEKYLQYQVLSNIYHDYELFEFPEISFCNLNPIYVPPKNTSDYNMLMHHIKNYEYVNKLNMSTKFLNGLSDYLYISRLPFNHRGRQFIIHCKYQNQNCNWKHFNTISVWPYGNCYTFNPLLMNSTRLVKKELIYNGYRPNLELVLYKAVDFPPELRNDVHKLVTMPSGIILMIHEPQSFPFIFEGFLLDFFTVIDMKITRKFHEPKLKNCIKIPKKYTYVDPVTNHTKVYVGKWADCLFNILQHQVVKSCNCLFETYPIPSNYSHLKFCKSLDINLTERAFRRCLQRAFSHILRLSPELNKCYKDLCTHSSYNMVISQAKYPAVEERNSEIQWLKQLSLMESDEMNVYNRSDLHLRALINNINNLTLNQAYKMRRKDMLNREFVDRNFMLFRVIPSSLFMDKVEEVAEYPMSRLLSDIGGCVGLWLGASLITVFELFDLVMESTEVFFNTPYYRWKRLEKQHRKRMLNQAAAENKDKSINTRSPNNDDQCFKCNNCRYTNNNQMKEALIPPLISQSSSTIMPFNNPMNLNTDDCNFDDFNVDGSNILLDQGDVNSTYTIKYRPPYDHSSAKIVQFAHMTSDHNNNTDNRNTKINDHTDTTTSKTDDGSSKSTSQRNCNLVSSV